VCTGGHLWWRNEQLSCKSVSNLFQTASLDAVEQRHLARHSYSAILWQSQKTISMFFTLNILGHTFFSLGDGPNFHCEECCLFWHCNYRHTSHSPIINFMKFLPASACCKRSVTGSHCPCLLVEGMNSAETCHMLKLSDKKSWNTIPQIFLHPPSFIICYCLISDIHVPRHWLHYFFLSVTNIYEQA